MTVPYEEGPDSYDEPLPEEVGLHAEELLFKVGDLVKWLQPTFGEVTSVRPHYFEVTFWTEPGEPTNVWSFDWDEEGHLFRRVKRPGE